MKLYNPKSLYKYLTFVFITMSLSSCISSEEKHEEDDLTTFSDYYFEKKDDEQFVTLSMSGWLAKTLLSNDDEEAKELLSSLDDIRLLIFEGEESANNTYLEELKKYLHDGHYQDIMIVKDGHNKIEFKIREGENGIDELLIFQNDGRSFVTLSLEGHLDFADISDPNTFIKLDQIQDLKKLQEVQ